MNAIQGKGAFASQDESTTLAGPDDMAHRSAKPRKGLRWKAFIVLAALGAGAYFWVFRAPTPVSPATFEQNASGPVAMRLSPIETFEIAPSDQQDTVRITGTLRPARQASISTRSAGTIEVVNVQPGDRVEQGDLIAELDTAELALQRQQQVSAIEATRSQLRLAQSQLETAQELAERGSGTRSTLETAQSNLDGLVANLGAQEAQLATLDLNLANALIRAPFSGIIADRGVDPGEAVNPGTPVATLVDTTEMEVVANASLSDALDIGVGQDVIITVESLRNRDFAGTVGRVSPVAAEGTRSLPVFLTLENPDGLLRGGMFVTGRIVVFDAQDVVVVPTGAVLNDDQGPYVLAIEEEHLVRRGIETGRAWTSSGMIEVVSGVETGDIIVGQELSGLAAGMPITLEEV